MRPFTITLLFAAALTLSGCDRADTTLERDDWVRVGRFENGLTYYVRENPKPKNRVELRLVLRAGSILEQDDQQGLAHLLEHMAFNGTEHFEKQEMIDYLESIGMRFGADLNAYTSFDETVYKLQVPTDDPELLETGLLILRDWAFGLLNEDVEIEKERGVVIEEWRLRRGASQRLRDKHFPVLFKGSQYAQRLPIGTKESLDTFKLQRVRDFYSTWYRPDLMAVIAVGTVAQSDIVPLIRKHFGSVPAVDDPEPRARFEVPDHDDTLVSIATDPEATSSSVSVYYKRPVQVRRTVEDYAEGVRAALFTGMLNARFNEIRRQPDAPFLSAYVYKGAFIQAKEFVGLGADVKDGEIEPGLRAVLVEAERVLRHGFTQTELDRARENRLSGLKRAHAERFTTPSGSYAGAYVRDFTRGEVVTGIETDLALNEQILPLITLEDVNALAADWFRGKSRVIMASAPEADEAPAEADALRALFAEAEAAEVAAYVDDVSDAPLIADLPAAGSVAERSEVPELGVTRWTLSNGARVVLKPTDFKKDEILFRAVSPGGHSLVVDDADYIPAATAASVAAEGGLGAFTKTQLQKRLAGKVAGVGAQISELQESLSGSTRPEDLETLMQLVHLRMSAPRKDAEAFEAQTARMREGLRNRLAQPETVFSDMVMTTLASDHPRRQPWEVATVDQMDQDASLALYRERFANAGDFTFFFVGSFDLAVMEELVSRYIASLPSTPERETWRDVGVKPAPGAIKKTVEKGAEQKSRVQMVYTKPFKWSFAERHILRSAINVLRIRLRETVREELGGSYHVSASAGISHYPKPLSRIGVSFGCAPEQVDTLIAAVDTEIAALRAGEFDDSYVEKIQEMQRREREVSLEKNGFWVYVLNFYEWHKEDPMLILDFENYVAGVTRERIIEIANTYFDTPNRAVFVLRPESGDASEAATLESVVDPSSK